MKSPRGKISIMSAAVLVAVFSIVSRILGLYRDRLLTSSFGAGLDLSAYFAAFRIPDIVFNIIVVGAISSAFIPVFTEYLEKKKSKEAFGITNSLMNILFVGVLIVCGVMYFLMPLFTNLVVPGFDAEGKALVVSLSRIMLLSPVFLCLSNIASGVLNSFNRFLSYSLTPVVYNLGIILGIIFLVPKFGIYGVAYGVVAGAFLHFIVQIPALIKVGYKFEFRFRLDSGVKKILKLMGPRVLGLAGYQINLFISNSVASTIALGSIAVYSLANNLQSVLYGAVGVSMATAVFPMLSSLAAKNDNKDFIKTLSKTIRQIMFFVIPLSIILILLRAQVVRLILGTGNFDWEDTVLTASALGFFTISLFAQSIIPVVAKAFYALKDTKTPVIISLISVGVNIVLNIYLAKIMGVAGLALAFSIASFVNMLLLIFVLHLRMGHLDDRRIISSVVKMVLASIVMILVVQGLSLNRGDVVISIFPGLKILIANFVDMHRFWGVFVQTLLASIGGLAVFVLVSFVMKLEEIDIVKGFWRKTLKIFGFLPFVVRNQGQDKV